MSISVKKDTKFPNASIALAQYFTNPRSMVEFAKQVAVYPSSAVGVRRSVLLDRRRPRSRTAPGRSPKDIVATYADIVPTVPKKADVNDIVLKAIESALFNNVACPDRPSTRPSPTPTSSSSSANPVPQGSHPALARSASGAGQPVLAVARPTTGHARHDPRDTP